MTLRHLNKLSKSRISGRTLVSVLLFVILTACGTNPVASSPPTGPLPSSTANKPIKTASAVPSVSLTVLKLNAAKITEDAGSLRVQSEFGFQCPNGAPYTIPMDQLVLASDRTTYSQDEIAQMGAYVSGNYSAWNSLSGGTEPPPTLRWVLGASMDPIPGTDIGGVPCGAKLSLTNTGSTPIQIPQVGVRLEGRPQPNAYTYHLIDACTVKPKARLEQSGCIPEAGGQSNCSTYTASIRLGLGEKDDVFSAVPKGADITCGPLTVAPDDQVDLIFKFSLAANIPKNLLYSITPLLTVNTAQGEQTVALSHLGSTLAFATANQFSCYGLQGTTFVLEPAPIYSDNQWCE